MSRVLGVDLGARRIGLALSDPLRKVASPLMTWQRTGDVASDHAAILRTAAENEAAVIVVGLPLSLSGRVGPAARDALAEVTVLSERAAALDPPVAVETCDERLTTVTAQRSLATSGVPAKKRRGLVDMVAAAVMLQSWLDGRPRPTP